MSSGSIRWVGLVVLIALIAVVSVKSIGATPGLLH